MESCPSSALARLQLSIVLLLAIYMELDEQLRSLMRSVSAQLCTNCVLNYMIFADPSGSAGRGGGKGAQQRRPGVAVGGKGRPASGKKAGGSKPSAAAPKE